MQNSLKRREIIGTFVGAFVGTLVSWLTLGQMISHLYTVAGLFLGAAAGYHSYSIWMYIIDKVSNAYAVLNLLCQPAVRWVRKTLHLATRQPYVPKRGKKPQMSASKLSQVIRGCMLVVALACVGLILATVPYFTGKWHQQVWVVLYMMFCGLAIMSVVAAYWLTGSIPQRSTVTLGRRELIVLGPVRFAWRVFRTLMGSAFEAMFYITPAFCVSILVAAVSLVLLVASSGVLGIPYLIVLYVFRLLYLAVTKRGHWFSFIVAAVVVYLSLWYRPWTGEETLSIAIAVALVNGAVACGAGILIRMMLNNLIARYNIKIDKSAPGQLVWFFANHIEQFFKQNANTRVLAGLQWLHRRAPLSPVSFLD